MFTGFVRRIDFEPKKDYLGSNIYAHVFLEDYVGVTPNEVDVYTDDPRFEAALLTAYDPFANVRPKVEVYYEDVHGEKKVVRVVLDRTFSKTPKGTAMPTTMYAIHVHVESTHDDKDREIGFEFVIREGNAEGGKIIGQSGKDVGLGAIWDEEEIATRVAITQYPFRDRLNLTLWHYYHNPSGGNQGWEGKIRAFAETDSGELPLVLAKTADYKLGESGNPKKASFKFNN
jgi:hypothetical protein